MLMLIVIWLISWRSRRDFNTSHVNVNHTSVGIRFCVINNFNTSHVNVNLFVTGTRTSPIDISIHLMLMLISDMAA